MPRIATAGVYGGAYNAGGDENKTTCRITQLLQLSALRCSRFSLSSVFGIMIRKAVC
ncbi:hypothetical protein SPV1_04433 [Mariprofundus ferrooxydans PV-1]|uniref:Uncharacterized protein n=1 Tax=Mariprofundus ferrooxydans PV-1 TaxID=314345 RepID=Q0F3A4_9PROT|nr:hypothetical protein SPV1_04433 [Mariprofundus ferrooxydans PV-1]